MKKTLKKQIVLFAVVAVMMIFALVMPASAAGVPCPNGGHLEIYYDETVCPPTCTQRGYTIVTCRNCNDAFVMYKDFTDPTEHDFEVSYEYDAESGTYSRVRTCKNPWLCTRIGEDPVSGIPSEVEIETYQEKDTGYILVQYINNWEPLDKNADAAAHKEAHIAGYYNASNPATWVLDCEAKDVPSVGYYATKVYTTGEEATVDVTKKTVDYEYINENGSLKLYVKEGAEIPAYEGKNPIRNKDKSYGEYEFTGWTEASEENGVKTFEANFKGEAVNVSASFYDHNGVMLSLGKTVAYGDTINYGKLVDPSRENDQQYSYSFLGWTFERRDIDADNEEAKSSIFGKNEDITLYFDTSLFAVYEKTLNEYTLNFRKYPDAVNSFTVKGETLGSLKLTYGSSFADHIKEISNEEYVVPADKKYLYERDERIWVIKSVNGNVLNDEKELSLYKFELPKSVYVKDKESGLNKTVNLCNGDEITVVPKYNKHFVTYRFKVSIKPVYFRDEDIYVVDNVIKSETLGDFLIQVTDENGQYIANGKTDKDGNFWFTAPYRDALRITASMSNVKYYGEHTIDLKSCVTADDIKRIADNGTDILPRVTQDWLDGLRGCGCICHSILSPIIIRIYNLLYNIFGIRYVCCDDLFIVHGNVLAYVK